MGRLTKWESTGSANWKVEYGYDSIGNLQSREESLNGTSQGVKTFATGYTDACKNTAGPHGVTTVTFAGTTQCYGYDARGQQTVGADQRTVAYTEYGLPTQITSNGVGWQFGYDATHRRATKTGPAGSTIYIGSLYEKRVSTGGTESHVMYVLAGGEVKAQIVVDATGSGEKIDYLVRDHLGSVTKTGGDGDWQDMRFDPYGSRISATPPPTPISDNPSSRVRLGFTGQEEDDDLALVNMNGRIYDPALARFLTPDPLVAMRSPSQSWNRYSYAENSPLRLVDPSGFGPQDGPGSYGGYNAPPGTHLDCNMSGACGYVGNTTGLPWGSNGWAGSSANNAVGANVGSFDEAGAGASSAQASSATGTPGGPSQGGGDEGDGALYAKNSSGLDTPMDPLAGNVRIMASGSDRKAVRAALLDILTSEYDGSRTRAAFVLGKLEAANIPTNISLDPVRLYSSETPNLSSEGNITSVDLVIGGMGLAKGPNVYPDGSIARLDTLLSHELPHVYGLIYENGVPMNESRAMTIENQYRASKGYEYSAPCIGRGYCD